MRDAQDICDCGRPDITNLETCRSCGYPVNFEDLRQQAIDTYDRDGRPIGDPDLPRRHLRIGNPSNSLRVLHLDDGAPAVLSGTFERASITHLPPYEAVSYCWGGEDGDYTKPEFIIIGGRLFPITKNCAAVLHKIRKPNKKRVVWIDSLCINQNDVNERSVQVSQMGKIFSGVRKVHIYVGNNIDGRIASKAFYVLRSMRNLKEFNMRLSDRVEAVKTLFAQTYFSRMWIIQEVLLAKTAALHWGKATIPWQTLREDHLEEFKKHGIDSCIPDWMRIRAMTKNFRNSETLGELLFSAMGSSASNDKDKVYGIYGLLFDAEEEGLTVDYGLSVKQIFTNMAAHLIKRHDAFWAVLRHVKHDAPLVNGEQLPSWVPDFRSRFVSQDVSMSRDGGLIELPVRSTITSQELILSSGTNELHLRGHMLITYRLSQDSPTEYSSITNHSPGMWTIRAKF
ncbi:HET domain-containing protein [Fusarium sp. Ph1]|nr:HET domain-containing protein [Fusarium sp. Ph1]